jgi:hypothetical protein
VEATRASNKEPLSEAKNQEILALQRTKGSRWASIAKGLQTNRTGLQICDHFRSLKGLWSYGWIPHNAGFGFLDLAPSILHSNWFWDYIS